MTDRQLKKRLAGVREPRPSPGLAGRLEAGIPDSFQRPESFWSPGRLWTMAKIAAVATSALGIVFGLWMAANLLMGPGAVNVAYADVLTPVAKATADVKAVHLVMQVRTREGENFAFVNLEGDLQRVEAWLQGPTGPGDPGRVRIEKSDRISTFDGREGILFFVRSNEAERAESCLGCGEAIEALWPASWVTEILAAPPKNVKVLAHEERLGRGRLLVCEPGVDKRPLGPHFWTDFDRETEITWDAGSLRLTGMRRWVLYEGQRTLFAEVESIDYPVAVPAERFTQSLPAGVRWQGLANTPPPSGEAGTGPEQVARLIFESAIRGDRAVLERHVSSPGLVDWLIKNTVRVDRIGTPFTTANYPGVHVPYEVEFKGALWGTRLQKGNLALKNLNPQKVWEWDGGI